MRSLRIICILLVLLPLSLAAQRENYVWLFGDNMGLDFNSGKPVVVPGRMSSYEGCASICDGTGKLLLYTDGMSVWNGKHNLISHGSNIGGDPDDAQSALILRLPGVSNIYYIFTNDRYHLAYSIVDLNANGGSGDVIKTNVTFMLNPTEGLGAALHCNGRDHWVVAQNVGNNRLYAFLFNENGLQTTPVISEAGTAPAATFGYIKFSPQSDKIVILKDLDREVYQFNRRTGKLARNIFNIRYSQTGKDFLLNYGFEFSPDGSKLYFCGWSPYLYQFDLSAGDSTAILNSRFGIKTNWEHQWSIALAPDNKLYMTVASELDIDEIANPNAKGAACNYIANAIDLKGRKAGIGLPTFAAGGNSISAKANFNVSTDCNSYLAHMTITDTSFADSIRWQLSGNNFTYSSTKLSDQVLLPGPGTYYLKLYMFSPCTNDTLNKELIVYKTLTNKDSELVTCPKSAVTIGTAIPGADKYIWSSGQTDSVVTVNSAGTYVLQVKRGNCQATYTYTLKNSPDIWTTLGREYYICDDEKELVKLDAGKGFVHYMWYPTGDSTQWIMVDRLGSYYVVVKDFTGCSGSDSTVVKRKCPGYLFFPNAFTPNADGHNDTYQPEGTDVLSYRLRIYTRWGEQVFETDKLAKGWNGQFKGQKAPEGIYIWTSEYSLLDQNKLESRFYKKGTLQLMR